MGILLSLLLKTEISPLPPLGRCETFEEKQNGRTVDPRRSGQRFRNEGQQPEPVEEHLEFQVGSN